jgi:hypothetical protein
LVIISCITGAKIAQIFCLKTLSLSFITKYLRYFCAGYTRNYDQQDNNTTSSDAKEMGEDSFALPSSSKWEVADRQEKMAKLDGVSAQAIKRMADAHHSSINDWLEIESEDTKDVGKKRVRWADIEERRKQVKMRDIGFVVGQTNWKRLMDPNEGTQQALERTKIIPNRFDDRS